VCTWSNPKQVRKDHRTLRLGADLPSKQTGLASNDQETEPSALVSLAMMRLSSAACDWFSKRCGTNLMSAAIGRTSNIHASF
jgi:hypothetical protein